MTMSIWASCSCESKGKVNQSKQETYKLGLVAELALHNLLVSFLVQICCFDLVLEEFQFLGLSAKFLDLSSLSLVRHLHASHLSSQTLLHLLHVDGSLALPESFNSWTSLDVLLTHTWVKSRLSEGHFQW